MKTLSYYNPPFLAKILLLYVLLLAGFFYKKSTSNTVAKNQAASQKWLVNRQAPVNSVQASNAPLQEDLQTISQ